MNLLEHAKHELELIGMFDGDGINEAMSKHILTMVQAFADEGHSGFYASYAIGLLEKLLRFQPLSPLTGGDDEWDDVSEICAGYKCYQNKRCSHVFKEEDGAYDSNGKVFIDKDGGSYTSRDSRVPVTFPYAPKIQYVYDGDTSNVCEDLPATNGP